MSSFWRSGAIDPVPYAGEVVVTVKGLDGEDLGALTLTGRIHLDELLDVDDRGADGVKLTVELAGIRGIALREPPEEGRRAG